MKTNLTLALLVGTLFLVPISSEAQQILTLNPEKSSLVVEGGSTLKDWKATAATMEGTCTIHNDSSLMISTADVRVEGKSLDGGRGPDMNAKIYKALDVEAHPQIIYLAEKTEIVEHTGNDLKLQTSGTLSIAGKPLPVSIELVGTASPMSLKGTHQVTFSQYEITPPSALFGQIVCDDEMKINIELVFE